MPITDREFQQLTASAPKGAAPPTLKQVLLEALDAHPGKLLSESELLAGLVPGLADHPLRTILTALAREALRTTLKPLITNGHVGQRVAPNDEHYYVALPEDSFGPKRHPR